MVIAIIDIYSERNARVSKDTNGAFGTVNDYGEGFIARLLTKVKAKSVDWPPLYSVYTTKVLKKQGHTVKFIRSTLGKFDISSLQDVDLCLVTTSIVCHETEVQLIKLIKQQNLPVGAIGSVATSISAPYLEAGAFVISGEPEFFFKQYPDLEALKSAHGIKQAKVEANLDQLEFPAWDVIFQHSTPRYKLLGLGETFLPILASRGCPYSCYHYCTYPLQQGRKLRTRSAQNIVAEMSHWQDTLGVSLFLFRDPVFSINRRHTVQLCEEIIASGRRFKFIVETHLKNLDEELIQLLKKAGLTMVKVGVESSDANILGGVNRYSIKNDEQIQKIRLLENQGIAVACFYMFGLPGDTEESCKKTIDYALKINSYGAQFSVFTPYPGTPIFAEYKDKLITKRYEDFTQWHLVFQHDAMSPKQMRRVLNLAYSRYYTRPSWALGKFAKKILTKR
jgi:anaerobic magnesium-protoporphyrin IX monomethyl ester cyclase